MIKNLLSTIALCSVLGVSVAQNVNVHLGTASPNITRQMDEQTNPNIAKTEIVNIGDTLHYFWNKHFFRNAPATGYYTIQSPITGTNTITHMGSKFLNSYPVNILGLEGIAARKGTSTSASVTIRAILCNVSGLGVPVLPGIDSISATLTGTAGIVFGGNFSGIQTMTANFAIVVRCAGAAGDTIKPYMNNASTPTATVPVNQRYGESLGYLRYNGNFLSTTNAFSLGSDYEFLVAPRVVFQTGPSYTMVPGPYCTNTNYNFTNTSGSVYKNRQFNVNEFYRAWKPFTNTVTITPDSVYTWNFGDGTGNMYPVNQVHSYALAATYNGTLTAKYQRMSSSIQISGAAQKIPDVTTINKVVGICAGVQNLIAADALSVYPNPSGNGMVTIANVAYESSLELYSMLGQSVFKDKAFPGNYSADFSNLPKGSYFLKIISNNEKAKIVKLILN